MHAVFIFVLCIQAYLALGDCRSGFCSPDETCCPGPYPGIVGCCPEQNAVCCSDGLSCCPANTVCNNARGSCISHKQQMIPSVFLKQQRHEKKLGAVSAQGAEGRANFVFCPDGVSLCPDFNTCCILPSGQWGCCPTQSGVCCSDKLHCCPRGTTCDATSQHCLQAGSKLPVALKQLRTPALLLK